MALHKSSFPLLLHSYNVRMDAHSLICAAHNVSQFGAEIEDRDRGRGRERDTVRKASFAAGFAELLVLPQRLCLEDICLLEMTVVVVEMSQDIAMMVCGIRVNLVDYGLNALGR